MPARPSPTLNPMQMRIRDLLVAAQKPLSAYDVIDALRKDGRLAPPTVYRALQKLIDEGLAHRLETQNAYVACRRCDAAHSHPHDHGHRAGFMICRACGKAMEFGGAEIDAVLARAAVGNGFSAERVAIEIQGLCADCAKAA